MSSARQLNHALLCGLIPEGRHSHSRITLICAQAAQVSPAGGYATKKEHGRGPESEANTRSRVRRVRSLRSLRDSPIKQGSGWGWGLGLDKTKKDERLARAQNSALRNWRMPGLQVDRRAQVLRKCANGDGVTSQQRLRG